MYHEFHEAHDEARSSRVTLLSGQSRFDLILDEEDWPTL